MAITAQFLAASLTLQGVTLRLDTDGGAGTKLTIASATILAALKTYGPLFELFNRSYASSQDCQDRVLSGAVVTQLAGDSTCIGADFIIMPKDAFAWGIDIAIDGDKPRIDIVGPANTTTQCFVRIQYRRSDHR